MIFGALIVGAGIGFVAMFVAIAAGASLISAFLTYWLASCFGTAVICLAKTLFCRDGMVNTSPKSSLSDQSTMPAPMGSQSALQRVWSHRIFNDGK